VNVVDGCKLYDELVPSRGGGGSWVLGQDRARAAGCDLAETSGSRL